MAKKTIAPKAGDRIAWMRGLKNPEVIRVHVLGPDEDFTLCQVLSTKHSPYLGTRGHVVVKTKDAVTCSPCNAKLSKLEAVKKASRKRTKTTKKDVKPVPQNAPVTSAAQATPAPILDAERTKDLPVPAHDAA